MTTGQKIQTLRKRQGMTQEQLAQRLGVSRQAVSRWEVGASAPGMDNLLALSKLYGVSLDELVGEAEPGAALGTQGAEAELTRYRHLNNRLGAALAAILLVGALLAGLYWGRHNAAPADRTEEGIPIVDIEDTEAREIGDFDVVENLPIS